MTIHLELMLACDLRYDVPQQVIATLKYLTRKEDYEFNDFPELPASEDKEDFYNLQWHPWRKLLQFSHYGPDFDRFPVAKSSA